MADRSPIKNSILKHAVSLKELTESELRGVGNMGFSDIYEELGDTSNDQENGLFMVENPQFNKQQNQEYLSELESSPWYHGCISRSKAEDILNESVAEGTFILRGGIKEGEYYISVRAPKGGPKIRHIEVNHKDDGFVAVCGPIGDAMEFSTFHELIEYLRSTPTHFEDFDYDITLKNFVRKKD